MSILKTGIVGFVGAIMLGIVLAGCGAADPAADVSDEATVGAAVGAVIGGQGSAASLRVAAAAIKAAEESERLSACDYLDESEEPSGVVTTPSVVPGTYGMSSDAVTVTAADGCDQGGEFAGFAVSEHELTCTDADGDETTVVMHDSSGIFREDLDAMMTRIYGGFNILFTYPDGSTQDYSDINCSLTIDHNSEDTEGEFGGGCEDGSGETVEPSNDVTCVDND